MGSHQAQTNKQKTKDNLVEVVGVPHECSTLRIWYKAVEKNFAPLAVCQVMNFVSFFVLVSRYVWPKKIILCDCFDSFAPKLAIYIWALFWVEAPPQSLSILFLFPDFISTY